MAHRNDDLSSALDRLGRATRNLSANDIAEVVAAALKSERREGLQHINRLFQLLRSSIKQLEAHAQQEKDRVSRLSRKVFALESEVRRIRAGKP
jgi:HAMP domain-containing protein